MATNVGTLTDTVCPPERAAATAEATELDCFGPQCDCGCRPEAYVVVAGDAVSVDGNILTVDNGTDCYNFNIAGSDMLYGEKGICIARPGCDANIQMPANYILKSVLVTAIQSSGTGSGVVCDVVKNCDIFRNVIVDPTDEPSWPVTSVDGEALMLESNVDGSFIGIRTSDRDYMIVRGIEKVATALIAPPVAGTTIDLLKRIHVFDVETTADGAIGPGDPFSLDTIAAPTGLIDGSELVFISDGARSMEWTEDINGSSEVISAANAGEVIRLGYDGSGFHYLGS